MKIAVPALLFVFLASFCFGQSQQYAHDVVKGAGYQVSLPADVVANISPNDEMAHGFAIDLLRPGDEHHWDRTPMRYIGFSTRWDAGDMPSLDAVVRQMLSDPEAQIPPEIARDGSMVRATGSFATMLGELPARRIVLEFVNADKKPAIRQVVVAYRARKDAGGMVYLATLTTTRADFPQDLKLFANVISGFKLTAEEQ